MSTENSNLIYVSARASFPWLASPQEQVNKKTGEKTYSYSTDLIFPANDPSVAKFMQAYAAIAADKWKENAQAWKESCTHWLEWKGYVRVPCQWQHFQRQPRSAAWNLS